MTKTRQIYNSKNKKYKKTKKNIKRGGFNDKSKFIPRKQKSKDEEILSTSAEHLINIITTNLNVIGKQCKDVLLNLDDYIFHIAHNSKWPDNKYTDFKEWCVYNKTQLDKYKGMKNELSKLQNDFPELNSVIVILQQQIEIFEKKYDHFKDVKCMSKERGRAQTPLPPTPKNKGRSRTTRNNAPSPPPRMNTTRRKKSNNNNNNDTYNHLENAQLNQRKISHVYDVARPVLDIDPLYAEYNTNSPYENVDRPSAIAPYEVTTNVKDIRSRKTPGNVPESYYDGVDRPSAIAPHELYDVTTNVKDIRSRKTPGNVPELYYDVVDRPSTKSSTTPAGEIRSSKPPSVNRNNKPPPSVNRNNKPIFLGSIYTEPEHEEGIALNTTGGLYGVPIQMPPRTITKSDCDKKKGYSWCPTNIPSKRCYNTANGSCLAGVKRFR